MAARLQTILRTSNLGLTLAKNSGWVSTAPTVFQKQKDGSACGRKCYHKTPCNCAAGATAGGRRIPYSQDWRISGAMLAAAIGSLGLGLYLKSKQSECKATDKDAVKGGVRKSNLPNYHQEEIAKHNNKKAGIWVTYKDGVYEITDFMEGHPGGEKILLAAGGQLEPFWDLYAIHNSETVFEMLEELRIGNIHPDDAKKMAIVNPNDPFANDPMRHPALRVNSPKPFNAEPPPELLPDNFLTPNDLFFVRNHLPVPSVDEKKHRLKISGPGMRRPLSLSVADLKKKFKAHTITATIQCAGNRRADMSKVKTVKGLSWGTAAISNAEWTGARLSDVLKYAGMKEDDENIRHMIFQGADTDGEGEPYESSLPAENILDPNKEVILAWAMNGKEIPRDHGFPLRLVVPGTIGARQVKWVASITASKEPSQSHWQKKDYRSFNPSADWGNLDYEKAIPIQEYPIQSTICEPKEGVILEDNEEVTTKGYAWSGGGRGIVRVDVSIDGGESWHEAELHQVQQRYNRQWAWTLWEITMPIAKAQRGKKIEIMVKATDTSHNTQPETIKGIWNVRGLINNCWHKVQIQVPKN